MPISSTSVRGQISGYNIVLGAEQMEKLLRKLPDEPYTSRAIYSILVRIAKPLVKMMKSLAPVSSKKIFVSRHNHFSRGNFLTRLRFHRPGELRRSIGIVKGMPRSKNPLIWVGPRYGKKTVGDNDAWYFNFVEYGVRSKNYPAKPFMRPAYDVTAPQMKNDLEKNFEKLLDAYITKHGPKHF